MRITAGTFRSRTIQPVPGLDTRPTGDKIKQSIFNMLGQHFMGGIMLDLFAGSGNMGFEALSRGIDKVIFVDASKIACQTIKTNIEALKVKDRTQLLPMDYQTALDSLITQTFDLVYLDPPYRHQQIASILHYLNAHNMVNSGGKIVCESLSQDTFDASYGSLHKIKDTTMGITRITIYERKSP